jgi:hypothetical protein
MLAQAFARDLRKVVPISPVWMRVCAVDVVPDQPQGGFIGGVERRAEPILLAPLREFLDLQARDEENSQHCNGKHLHRYLAEFYFRYNTRTATTTSMRAEEQAPDLSVALQKIVSVSSRSEGGSTLGNASWHYVN